MTRIITDLQRLKHAATPSRMKVSNKLERFVWKRKLPELNSNSKIGFPSHSTKKLQAFSHAKTEHNKVSSKKGKVKKINNIRKLDAN